MITNPSQHVAKRFYDCFARGTRGTDHKTLISMVCRYRDPNDLDIIQTEFRNQYHCLLDTKIYEEKLGGGISTRAYIRLWRLNAWNFGRISGNFYKEGKAKSYYRISNGSPCNWR